MQPTTIALGNMRDYEGLRPVRTFQRSGLGRSQHLVAAALVSMLTIGTGAGAQDLATSPPDSDLERCHARSASACQRYLERLKRSGADFDTLVDAHNSGCDAGISESCYEAGELYARAGDLDGALFSFEEACKRGIRKGCERLSSIHRPAASEAEIIELVRKAATGLPGVSDTAQEKLVRIGPPAIPVLDATIARLRERASQARLEDDLAWSNPRSWKNGEYRDPRGIGAGESLEVREALRHLELTRSRIGIHPAR